MFIKRFRYTAWVLIIVCSISFGQIKRVYANGISAQAYVVMDFMSKEVAVGENIHKKLPMASTTKIMSALIVLEQEDLDKPFVVDKTSLMVEGSSMGLQEGDTVTLRTLAYGMLLASGNDAANAAAVRTFKTSEKFVAVMNKKAKEIGMNNTNFKNPSGLPDEEHYSTAYDMGILACNALKNSDFAKICATKQAKLEYGNPPYTRYLSNHNKLLWGYDGAIGLKTGFTKKAGRCLVSAAKKEEQVVVCVTLNASDDWDDHEKLLDLGFDKCKPIVMDTGKKKRYINVINPDGKEQKVLVQLQGIAYNYLPLEKQKEISSKEYLFSFYYAPLEKGQIVGKIEYIYKGEVIFTSNIVVK